MRKLFTVIVLSITLLTFASIAIWHLPAIYTLTYNSIDHYHDLDQELLDNRDSMDRNAIPDVHTAAVIGGVVLDHMAQESYQKNGKINVFYDDVNQNWIIHKVYIKGLPFYNGGILVLDQNSGAVVGGYLTK